MFELAGGVGLGVDVADLLHLETSFQADGVVQTAPNEEDVVGVGVLAGEPLDALLVLQHPLNLFRQGLQLADEGAAALLINAAAHLGKLGGEQIDRRQLGAVGLGGGHRDFRPGVGVQQVIALPRDAGAHHVDDTQHRHALVLGKAQGGQAVGGLARLGDDDHQRIFHQLGVAVAELGGKVDLDRQVGHRFDDVFSRRPDVVGRAAGHKVDAFQLL